MRIRLSWTALVVTVLLLAMGRGASAGSSNATDEKAIREIETRWESAWNHHDVAGMAATYAPDADAINLAGEWFQGRDAFQKSLEELHSGKTQGSVWRTERTEIKFLTPEIAIVHVYANSHGDRNPNGSVMAPRARDPDAGGRETRRHLVDRGFSGDQHRAPRLGSESNHGEWECRAVDSCVAADQRAQVRFHTCDAMRLA